MPILDEMGDNLDRDPINPFHVDIVVERFLARAEVASLKKLAGLDAKWNHLATNELERKASNAQLTAIDLSGESYQEKIDEFLDKSWSNPKLFRSFRLNFESLKNNMDFISEYSPNSIQLDIIGKIKFTKDELNVLRLFLALIAPEVQNLEIYFHDPSEIQWGPRVIQTPHPKGPVFPKLKRLACIGIHKQWDDRIAMLVPFTFLMNKNGKIDHTPNLTALEMKLNMYDLDPILGIDHLTPIGISRWSKLTHLTIYRDVGLHTISDAEFIHSLGQGEMRLEFLDLIFMDIDKTEWPAICRNLSGFFQTQEKSLKILDLTLFSTFNGGSQADIVYPKIKLPIFEELHTLKLKGNIKVVSLAEVNKWHQVPIRMFEMGPLPAHFPKLYHLEVHNHELLASLFPEGAVEPMKLQSLLILHDYTVNGFYFDPWHLSFGDKFQSLKSFACCGKLLQPASTKKPHVQYLLKALDMLHLDERKVPWEDSLRVLKIDTVQAPLNVAHLTKLEEIIVTERKAPTNPDEYLSFFKEVRRLKLSEISFEFEDKQISDEDIEKFEEYFTFQVVFLVL